MRNRMRQTGTHEAAPSRDRSTGQIDPAQLFAGIERNQAGSFMQKTFLQNSLVYLPRKKGIRCIDEYIAEYPLPRADWKRMIHASVSVRHD